MIFTITSIRSEDENGSLVANSKFLAIFLRIHFIRSSAHGIVCARWIKWQCYVSHHVNKWTVIIFLEISSSSRQYWTKTYKTKFNLIYSMRKCHWIKLDQVRVVVSWPFSISICSAQRSCDREKYAGATARTGWCDYYRRFQAPITKCFSFVRYQIRRLMMCNLQSPRQWKWKATANNT